MAETAQHGFSPTGNEPTCGVGCIPLCALTSVPAAATQLGISSGAVRQRIKRDALRDEKRAGRWYVALPSDQTTEPIEARYRVTPEEIGQAVKRTGAGYLADMRFLFAELDSRYERLYGDQLEAKDGRIAELRQRAEVAEAERDQLRAYQAATPADPPWWKLWGL